MESIQQKSTRQLRESSAAPRFVSSSYDHIPVLGDEVVRAFDLGRPALIVDGTLGLGGHSERLLKAYPEMQVLGVEWDAAALSVARERLAPFEKRFESIEASYADLPSILSQRGRGTIDGILLTWDSPPSNCRIRTEDSAFCDRDR